MDPPIPTIPEMNDPIKPIKKITIIKSILMKTHLSGKALMLFHASILLSPTIIPQGVKNESSFAKKMETLHACNLFGTIVKNEKINRFMSG